MVTLLVYVKQTHFAERFRTTLQLLLSIITAYLNHHYSNDLLCRGLRPLGTAHYVPTYRGDCCRREMISCPKIMLHSSQFYPAFRLYCNVCPQPYYITIFLLPSSQFLFGTNPSVNNKRSLTKALLNIKSGNSYMNKQQPTATATITVMKYCYNHLKINSRRRRRW